MENILALAVLIAAGAEEATGHIGLGCSVKVRYEEDGEEIEEDYEIVGSQEANPMAGRISDDSPFGRAVMGHAEGDIVEVDAPAGSMRYTIVSVEKKS